jgi:hypothetical protein
MKRLTSALVLTGALSFGIALTGATSLVAAPTDESAQAQARFRPRIGDRQVQTILMRIRSNGEALVQTLDGIPARGRVYSNRTRTADDVSYLVEDLVTATNHLDDHISRALATRADVDDLLRRAALVDTAFGRTSQGNTATTAWTTIRRDVDSVANAYGLTWNWGSPEYSNEPATGVYRQLQGTYTMDVGRSDNAQRTIDAALRSVSAADRDRVTRQLNNRLDQPELVAIDRTGGRTIIASTRGPQYTFEADGQARTEQGPGGQSITTRASLYGDQLNVTTTGMANNEFRVTFEPLRGGQELRVTRLLYNDALARPVSLQTIYRRTSETPDWDLYNRPATGRGTRPAGNAGNTGVIVPNGTVLSARLDQPLNLRQAREEDRITLTVHNAPRPELEGATIEGYVTSNLSSLDERSRVALQFDTIRLRNGRTSDFDGVIESIVGPNGQTIRFDGEVATVDRDKSSSAVQRGALGAVVGGLIGALAGGGKGAVIGAAIGGGGAAATVLIDNPSQPELQRGTDFTIRARSR